jgi:site-specific DNA-methyltransferase (adenine-specific)
MELNKIYCIDCMEGLKELQDKTIDMILCDLPYGVTHNEADKCLPLVQLWEQYSRIIKDDGVIVLTAQYPFTCRLEQTAPKCFKSYELIWDKILVSGFLNANRMPLRVHENIIIFYKKQTTYNPQFTDGVQSHSKGKPKLTANNNYGEHGFVDNRDIHGSRKFPMSIIRIQKPHPSKALHRTEKPVELFAYLIKTFSNVGDVILDNCMGCGTTAVACSMLNRKFIGFEIDAELCKIAERRINEIEEDGGIPPAPKEAGILPTIL